MLVTIHSGPDTAPRLAKPETADCQNWQTKSENLLLPPRCSRKSKAYQTTLGTELWAWLMVKGHCKAHTAS